MLVRSAREQREAPPALHEAANRLADRLADLGRDGLSTEGVRGHEGEAAAGYFAAFGAMIRSPDPAFGFSLRSRRPPLDAVNALLSFVYALLRHDCASALSAVGLDPAVGYLHADRPRWPRPRRRPRATSAGAPSRTSACPRSSPSSTSRSRRSTRCTAW